MIGELIMLLYENNSKNIFKKVLDDSFYKKLIHRQEDLNYLSHENVSRIRVDKDIIERINNDMKIILDESMKVVLQ